MAAQPADGTETEMKTVADPTFSQVFRCLQENGPAHVVSTIGTSYQVIAETQVRDGRQVIVGRPGGGQVRVHEDCWGDDITCQGTRAGGIFNGSPSIYDWYRGALRTGAPK
jgi:NAD(P)H-dependent flavin oxidoreductase YrpB (nitropropane dioxygenase family)